MDQKYIDLIVKDLTGNISPDERRALRQWLPGNEKLYAEMQDLWERSRVNSALDVNETEAWEKLKLRIEKSEQPSVPFYRRRYVQTAAAVILLTLLATLFVIDSVPRKEEIASEGHVEIFYLPDSSQVWLNKNSILTIENFDSKERVVSLKGEAFFQVKKDSTRPFLVYTENSSTRVLGTSFSIKAYPSDRREEINVESGKVEFSGKKKGSVLKLERDQRAYIDKQTGFAAEWPVAVKQEAVKAAPEWRNKRYKNTSQKKRSLLEISRPGEYLHHDFSWKKNFLKQVIIEGQITNGAIFTTYKNIKLKATYYSQEKGKAGVDYYTLSRHVKPGHRVSYKFRLSNWFRQAEQVKVEIEEAHAIQ